MLKSVNTLMQKVSNIAYQVIQMMMGILLCEQKKDFWNLVQGYKKTDDQEDIVKAVKWSKGLEYTQ